MSEQASTPTNPVERATELARLRTQLALDRTTLAWLRTSTALATFGFGTVGFFRSLVEKHPDPRTVQLHQYAIQFGISLLVLGILATVLSGVAHLVTLRRLRRGDPLAVEQWPLSLSLAILLSILGLVGLVRILT